jgi:co-chaperonin GroES (HSP10)
MQTAQPLWGNVLIRATPLTRTTKSGIELPEEAKTKNTIAGVVISVGTGSLAFDGTPIPMKIVVGNKVLFKKYEAELVTIAGESLFLVDQRQVLAVLYD